MQHTSEQSTAENSPSKEQHGVDSYRRARQSPCLMPHVIRTGKVHHIIKVDNPRQTESLCTWTSACHGSENITLAARAYRQNRADMADSSRRWALHHVWLLLSLTWYTRSQYLLMIAIDTVSTQVPIKAKMGGITILQRTLTLQSTSQANTRSACQLCGKCRLLAKIDARTHHDSAIALQRNATRPLPNKHHVR